jgi:hypothetical protein
MSIGAFRQVFFSSSTYPFTSGAGRSPLSARTRRAEAAADRHLLPMIMMAFAEASGAAQIQIQRSAIGAIFSS